MRRFQTAALLAFCCVPALAQPSPPGRPDNPGQAGQDVPAQVQGEGPVGFRPDFVDPGNGTAKAVAAALGISVGEATRRLVQQQRSVLLAERLSARFPDTFTGLKFEQRQGFRIRALFARGGAQADVDSAVREAGLTERVEVGQAALSRSDEARLGAALLARLNGRNVSFEIDPERGVLTWHTSPDEALSALAREAAAPLPLEVAFDPGGAIIPTYAGIAGQAYNASGGNNAQCTTGFAVIQKTGSTKGLSTAGHCHYNSPAEFDPYMNTSYGSGTGNTLTFQQEWVSNGLDVQWHLLAETDDVPRPYYWNGTESIPVTSRGQGEPQAGWTLCKWGRTTEWDCSTTGNRVYDSAYSGYFYTLLNTGARMSEGGDSGGPIVSGGQAWGWTHGRNANYDNIFTSMQNFYDKTPFTILGCTTC